MYLFPVIILLQVGTHLHHFLQPHLISNQSIYIYLPPFFPAKPNKFQLMSSVCKCMKSRCYYKCDIRQTRWKQNATTKCEKKWISYDQMEKTRYSEKQSLPSHCMWSATLTICASQFVSNIYNSFCAVSNKWNE